MSNSPQQCKLSESLIYSLTRIVEKDSNNYCTVYKNLSNILSNAYPNIASWSPDITDKKIKKYEKISKRFADSFYDEILGHNISLESGKFNREYPERGQIGRGNCGDVYKAKSKSDNEVYAFKEIETNASDIVGEFGEVRNLAKLRNKNIVDYKSTWIEYVKDENNCQHDICLDVDQGFRLLEPKKFRVNQYIQMELCQMTISEGIRKIRSELLPNIDFKNPAISYIATQLLLEVIRGLNYLHTRKPALIHPDLHSGNVFLSDGFDGNFVRIGDFAPNSNFQEMNENKPSKKSNIQQVGILFGKLLGLTDASGSSSQSQTLAFSEEIENIMSQIPKDEKKSYIKILKSLLGGKFEKRSNCTKILLDHRTWIVKKNDIMHEKSIKDIINTTGDLEYNNIEQLSYKIIVKKFETEINNQYKRDREQRVTKKDAQTLGRDYANIIKCRKSNLNIKCSEGLQNTDVLNELIRYAFIVNYRYEDISKFLSEYMSSSPQFTNGNSNNWFCFIWIHNSDSILIDWLKNDTYLVEVNDEPKPMRNKTLLLIFRDRQSIASRNCDFRLIYNTFESQLSEEIQDEIKRVIDQSNPPVIDIRRMIENSLNNRLLNWRFMCHLTLDEYYLLIQKHDKNDYILAFSYKKFCGLVTTRLQSPIREWPEIIDSREKLSLEDREIIERGLLAQKCYIDDTTSIKIISSEQTDKRCLIFHNSRIDDKYPKGIFDTYYYLKSIKCNLSGNQNNNQIIDNQDTPIAATSRDNEHQFIKYSISNVSKSMPSIDAHIKLCWFDRKDIIQKTPNKRKMTTNTPEKWKISDYLRGFPADKKKRLEL